MEIGKEYEVDVIDMSPNGEGIAKIKTFPVFIKGAKLNEHVKVRITALVCGAADAEVVP
jgi:23S rRNA (uracil1939-C5)-methyltransferase